jgi:hypothetical protein
VSRALETYLLKLYLDRDARAPLDRQGLELAARAFAATRAASSRGGRWARLVAAWRRRRARA